MSSQLLGIAQDNIAKLQRFQAIEMHIARLLGGWLPGIALWEAKHEVGLHIWQNAESSRVLRTRLWELRVADPDREVIENLRPLFTALARARYDYELLAAVYLVLKRDLLVAYRDVAETPYDIYDYPTVPVMRQLIATTEQQIEWATRLLNQLTDSGEKKRNTQRWMQFARDLLDASGGIDGQGTASEDMPEPPPAYEMRLPFAEAARDERFEITPAGLPIPDENDTAAFTLWQFANYGMEMQAAETLASCLWEVEGMAWEFYYDIARHCWDEVRHSQLGCRRLQQLGHHISDFPHSVGSYAWRQLFSPLIRYCALTYVIEAGAFKLKHETYQKYVEVGDIESAQAVMYDILDETLHVRWGKKWVPPLMAHYEDNRPLAELVDECRQIVASHTVATAQKVAAERDIKRKGRRTLPQPQRGQ